MVDTGLIFLDFEYITTQFKSKGKKEYIQEIVEAAYVYVANPEFCEFSSIIQPTLYLISPKKNSNFYKFTESELYAGMTLKDFVIDFQNKCGNSKIRFVSWGGSDISNFNKLCSLYNIDFKISNQMYIDLSQKFRRFYKHTQSIKLSNAMNICNITILDAHRALPDTQALVLILNKMLSDGFTHPLISTEGIIEYVRYLNRVF